MGERFENFRNRMIEKSGCGALVEIYSTSELLLTGCTSLCDFDDTYVIAETVNGPVTVFGKQLKICTFRADLLSIKGEITKVEFGETQ